MYNPLGGTKETMSLTNCKYKEGKSQHSSVLSNNHPNCGMFVILLMQEPRFGSKFHVTNQNGDLFVPPLSW